MKLIENSSAYVAAGSALFAFSVLEIGSSLGRLVVLPNSNDLDRTIFYALLGLLIFAALSSLGLLLRIRAAYFGAVLSSLSLLGHAIFRMITVVPVTAQPGFGVLQSTAAPMLTKAAILLITAALLGSKSVRGMFVVIKGEHGEGGKASPATS
ncbi:MAG: hypothetical protein JNK37_04465 [Verrucomicrobiales bacterium]|nr:hypothetical protein [Verrucomicrobiales bacterium]